MGDPRATSNPTTRWDANAEDVVVDYSLGKGRSLRAVDHVSFELRSGEVLGVVGESGSGKSTLGKVVAGFLKPTSGRMLLPTETSGLQPRERRDARGFRDVQMIFQESVSALNPRLPVWRLIAEALDPAAVTAGPLGRKTSHLKQKVWSQIERVGLPPGVFIDKRPGELSGGEKQRVAIARALAASPVAMVCDESVSALDVSIRAVVLNLFKRLSREAGIALLFITHDISVVAYIADQIAVMHQGEIVEYGPPRRIIDRPEADYTRKLIAAVPRLEQTLSTAGHGPAPLDQHA